MSQGAEQLSGRQVHKFGGSSLADPSCYRRVAGLIEQQGRGIGTVMLVSQDTSTEWYPGERASEVRHITGYHDANGKWRNGRVSFINKATGEEMKGNPKGSMLLIFAPNWRGECRIRDVSKLTLLLAGAEPISAAA